MPAGFAVFCDREKAFPRGVFRTQKCLPRRLDYPSSQAFFVLVGCFEFMFDSCAGPSQNKLPQFGYQEGKATDGLSRIVQHAVGKVPLY